MTPWPSGLYRSIPAAAALGVAVFLSAAAQEVVSDSSTPGAAELAIEFGPMLSNLDIKIDELDLLIADHEAQLDRLYAQRDASESDPERVSFDRLIDRITLNLDQMEMLRETLKSQAETLRRIVDYPRVAPSESRRSEQ